MSFEIKIYLISLLFLHSFFETLSTTLTEPLFTDEDFVSKKCAATKAAMLASSAVSVFKYSGLKFL
jgi:hypothetical protein